MRIKVTTLSPVHISSGNEYELNFNLLIKDNKAYIYDEFKIAEFFIQKNITIPTKIEKLKELIEKEKNEIINANIHIRAIDTNFDINKPLLEHISTQNNPIIPGSSIKGAIETAIFDLLVKNSDRVDEIKNILQLDKISYMFKILKNNYDLKEIKKLLKLPNDTISIVLFEMILQHSKREKLNINSQLMQNENLEKEFNKTFKELSQNLKKIFSYLKISDSFQKLNTYIYKTINIKKKEEHQKNREDKVEKIANYVEAIKSNQSFVIILDDLSEEKIFKNIGRICNGYYIPKINQDIKYYFYKKNSIPTNLLKNLNNNKFILNIGRFSGAEKKSIDKFRFIRNSHCTDKSKTSAITFALEKSCNDNIYFRDCLIPFGWILCEIKE